MIDSHCHLADAAFADDLQAVVDRARAVGLERALVVLTGGDKAEAARAARVLELWPDARVAVGVHPHVAHEYADDASRAAAIVRQQIALTPACRAVGEIGLDYHYDFTPRALQQQVFRWQVRLACDLDLPLVIHTREADDDTLAILREEGDGAVRGVLHCFTGNNALADAALALGFYISFAGIITFPKAESLRETARRVPLERVLVETDSPFLAPAPNRGKRNEPALVVRVAERVAELHGIELSALAARATANFHALFRP
jgi:TatD DNase family protein